MRIYTPKDFGSLIRQSRKDQGFTQAQLADLAGVSRDWIIRLEQGKRTVELGLAMRTLRALKLQLRVQPEPPLCNDDTEINLDAILNPPTDKP